MIRATYAYNYVHNATSINDMLSTLAAVEKIHNLRKAKAPGELADSTRE